MPLDEELRQIAEHLRERLSTSKVYSLFGNELSCFWGHREDLPAAEKQMYVENFASHFGFKVLVNEEVSAAAFARADERFKKR